ncbi:uncharacterized protein LACBIDRAFT_312570 [Laccaria bicolor S238N-H82]|uniref:Signal recognition particle subunit SRP14 n=1 Tax=Laccaria bicolor (strain S238N-H82 / ATCC MYA-4686) TaxID=486041 RepID=B0DWF4_LACBS|nr:uncharacterized protein LACBIDRAFT_312570 [Laccaria bicolor S238N-H82]EDR01078.1 predicted protein [Laccaria bicolor S238N-H82]|eukprot:XP_001888297.1 predicted protein [Laccaria bicolor S238N-H82]
MMVVDNDVFLKHLSELFEASKEHGSIWLTHKRLTHDTTTNDDGEYPVLLRVNHGGAKESKISTIISPGALPAFHAHYAVLLKAHLTPLLRKRDKKREKVKSDLATKRKKRMTEPIVVEGPKRGNGRRKRQRLVKAVKKQESSQKAAAARTEEEEKRKRERV